MLFRSLHKDLQVRYVATGDQLADIFTKSLSSFHFLYLHSKTMVSLAPLVLRGDENRITEVTKVEDAQS